MSRRWTVMGAVMATGLLVVGLAAWHFWPRTVAPDITPQMVSAFNSSGAGTITVIDGGSKQDAHTLWKRYHDRPAYGTPPQSPRLLGISLVKFRGPSGRTTSKQWVVYSDRVWMSPVTGGKSGFGTQAILLDPKTLQFFMQLDQ